MPTKKLKVWIVRNSARSIQFGGLERLFVHFSEPTFFYEKNKIGTGDLPFSEPTDINGIYKESGWRETQPKTWVAPVSVGNWLGYDNEISQYIWKKLHEHFKNKPINTWDTMEKCLEVRRENFILELELDLTINQPI